MVRRAALILSAFLPLCFAQAAQITQFSPQGRVSVVESVKATFDVPVVAVGDDQAAAPLRVECDDAGVKGQGRWVDARRWTYVFIQAPGPGVRCEAKVDKAFRTLAGETLRGIANRTGVPLVVSTYGIYRGFYIIEPGSVPEGHELYAAWLDGLEHFGRPITLAEVTARGRFDLLVTGASAVSMEGVRFGKGHGFFDLEWGMFTDVGIIDEATPVVKPTGPWPGPGVTSRPSLYQTSNRLGPPAWPGNSMMCSTNSSSSKLCTTAKPKPSR